MNNDINKSDWLLIILLAIVAATAIIKARELTMLNDMTQWTSQGH